MRIRWVNTWSLAAFLFCFGLFTLSAKAEVFNKEGFSFQIEVCKEYLAFLEGVSDSGDTDCHRLARFLIANDDDGLLSFLERLMHMFGENSSLGAATRTVWETVHGNAVSVFTWSEIAARRIAIRMASSGDIERAVLYSHLLSEVQRDTLSVLCAPKIGCDAIEAVSSVSDILGSDYGDLDIVRADIVLLCLLKTDAFLVSIRDVMASRKFNNCISNIVRIE